MTTKVQDVAAYIKGKLGPVAAMKLQKLVYYSQAWNLAWYDRPLFPEAIEGWKNGPVVRALHNRAFGGNPAMLSAQEKDSVNRVLARYGTLTGNDLSALTHGERPWIESRRGLKPNDPGSTEIDPQVMRHFYKAQEQQMNEAFSDFNLTNMKVEFGRVLMFGTRREIDSSIDHLARTISRRDLPLSAKRLLVQSAGRCEYQITNA
jgi:uncharacterized phage-associated protein